MNGCKTADFILRFSAQNKFSSFVDVEENGCALHMYRTSLSGIKLKIGRACAGAASGHVLYQNRTSHASHQPEEDDHLVYLVSGFSDIFAGFQVSGNLET